MKNTPALKLYQVLKHIDQQYDPTTENITLIKLYHKGLSDKSQV